MLQSDAVNRQRTLRVEAYQDNGLVCKFNQWLGECQGQWTKTCAKTLIVSFCTIEIWTTEQRRRRIKGRKMDVN